MNDELAAFHHYWIFTYKAGSSTEWGWLIVQGPGHERPVLPVNGGVLCRGRNKEPLKDSCGGKGGCFSGSDGNFKGLN